MSWKGESRGGGGGREPSRARGPFSSFVCISTNRVRQRPRSFHFEVLSLIKELIKEQLLGGEEITERETRRRQRREKGEQIWSCEVILTAQKFLDDREAIWHNADSCNEKKNPDTHMCEHHSFCSAASGNQKLMIMKEDEKQEERTVRVIYAFKMEVLSQGQLVKSVIFFMLCFIISCCSSHLQLFGSLYIQSFFFYSFCIHC